MHLMHPILKGPHRDRHIIRSGDDGDEGGGGDRPQRLVEDGLRMVRKGAEGGTGGE